MQFDIRVALGNRALLAVALAITVLYASVAVPLLSNAGSAQLGLHGPSSLAMGFASATLAITLIALSTIDAFTLELPDILTLPLAAAGVLVHLPQGLDVAAQQLLSAFVAFAVLAGFGQAYFVLRGLDGLGLGDAKLFAAAGAWLGLHALPLVLALAAAAALASVAIAALRSGSIAQSGRLPFGPYLALSIWLLWLYGPEFAALALP